MGKSIRSKRQKQLRTIKRKALGPSETLKVTHLNAKLQAYIKRSNQLDSLDQSTATKDEDATTAPLDPILQPTPSKSFVHSHPKPRDPADPTIRPYPRGKPRDTGRLTFQQAVERERRVMDDVEVGDEVEESKENEEAVSAARVKVESVSGEVVMLTDDEEGNPAEVSYVPLGRPARAKRANKHKGKTTTRGGKKMSRSASVVANWKRLGGGRNGLVS